MMDGWWLERLGRLDVRDALDLALDQSHSKLSSAIFAVFYF
jgi:hypothetical protein